MDVDCAKAALRTLVYYEFIALLDIFQFSNIYVTTELFTGMNAHALVSCPAPIAYFELFFRPTAHTELVRNQSLQRECQSFVCTDPASPLPIPEILRLYAACRPNVTLSDVFITQKEKMDHIDPRR